MGEGIKEGFPRNIKPGDELLVRCRVVLTHIHRAVSLSSLASAYMTAQSNWDLRNLLSSRGVK